MTDLSRRDMQVRATQVRAVFDPDPRYTHSLRPELLELVGEEALFRYAWKMDDDDQFPGVWAMVTDDRRWLGLWIPEFDLKIVRESKMTEEQRERFRVFFEGLHKMRNHDEAVLDCWLPPMELWSNTHVQYQPGKTTVYMDGVQEFEFVDEKSQTAA